MPDLICGKAAVGGNYNSTHDINVFVHTLILHKLPDSFEVWQ